MDVGTRVSFGAPASFKLLIQNKVGGAAVEGWVPSLLYWELSSPLQIAVIAIQILPSSAIQHEILSLKMQKHYTLTAVTEVSQNTEGEIVPNTLKSQTQCVLNGVPQISGT